MAGDGGGGALDAGPGADAAVPADDGVEDAGVVLDLGVLEDDGLLDAGSGADVDAGADGDVGAQLGGGVDVGGGVDEDGRDDVVGHGLRELGGLRLQGLLQVQGIGGDGGAGGLDLAPEVLGLVDEELLVVGELAENVLLEADDLLVVLVVVGVGGDEAGLEVVGGRIGDETGALSAALDGGLDAGEDGLGAEEVDAAVDEVGDVALGLLDVVQDAAGVGIGDDATEVGGGVLGDAGAEDDGLGILVVEELGHLVQGERAADVGVEDEDALGTTLEDGITEVVETTGGAEGLILAEVLDGEVREFGGGLLDEVFEHALVVVADHADLLDRGYFGNGGQTMPDDGVACDIEEGLYIFPYFFLLLQLLLVLPLLLLTLGTSRDNGRNLVPREGPPT